MSEKHAHLGKSPPLKNTKPADKPQINSEDLSLASLEALLVPQSKQTNIPQDPKTILGLQRVIGNTAVQRLVNDPNSPAEREAESVSKAVVLGRTHPIKQKPDAKVQRALPVILGALAVASLGLGAASLAMGEEGDYAYKQNREKEKELKKKGESLEKDSLMALIPFYGSYLMVEQATSPEERALGYTFLALDIGGVGAILKAGRGVTMVARQMGNAAKQSAKKQAVKQTAGKEIGQEAVKATYKQGSREVISTTADDAAAHLAGEAFEVGAVIVAAEKSATNHIVTFVKGAEGWIKFQGDIGKAVSKVADIGSTIGVENLRAYAILSRGNPNAAVRNANALETFVRPYTRDWAYTCSSASVRLIDMMELGVRMPKGKIGQMIPINLLDEVAQSAPVRVIAGQEGKLADATAGFFQRWMGFGIGGAGTAAKESMMGEEDMFAFENEATEEPAAPSQVMTVMNALFDLKTTPSDGQALAEAIKANLPGPLDLNETGNQKAMYHGMIANAVDPQVAESAMQHLLRGD